VANLLINNGTGYTGFSDGTYGYAAGGEVWFSNNWFGQNTVMKFDPNANRWAYAPSMLDQMFQMAPFVINGIAYLAGGMASPTTSTSQSSEVQAYFTNMALYVQQQMNNLLAWLAAKQD
jgi:hypothetical protein